MKNKSLLLSIFLILAVILSSSAVFAEDTDEGAKEKAVEKSKQKLGFEQIDPNKSTRTKKKTAEE